MKYTSFIRMSDLHAMPITNITHSACYSVEMGVSTGDLTRITLDNNHTAYKHICLQGIGCVRIKNYPHEIMQPSSSTRATIVRFENQIGATIVKATFHFCHYYIVWESNNAGEARGQSWNESLKSNNNKTKSNLSLVDTFFMTGCIVMMTHTFAITLSMGINSMCWNFLSQGLVNGKI